MELKLLLVLALVVGIQAGPIDTVRDSCSRTCSNTNKFGYMPGKSYEFNYNVKTSTRVKGASEGLSGMELTAKVHVEAVSKCDFVLRIEDVQLHEIDPNSFENKILSAGSDELRMVLERHDLRFSFQDGIVDELCPSSDEVTWALNIKRGILSVFQNSMDDLRRSQKTTESDVNGNCEVEYSADSSTNGYAVRKTKNLLGCTERNEYSTSIQGIPYRVPSGNQAVPLLKSEHQCHQDISPEGLLQTARCVESHLFQPLSREGSGAVTESKQTLHFVQESIPAATPGAVRDRRGMNFEHAYDADKSMRTQAELENKLMEICENTRRDVRPDTPKLFTELVYVMKTVTSQSLRAVYQKLRSGTICADNIKRVRKFFLDAVPMAGTSDSMTMLTELINNADVTGVEADMWLTTLSFIQHPTKDMLREVMPLLNRNNGKAMLAVASLVHNFCRRMSCEGDLDVNNIISMLEDKIEYGCYVDGDKLHKTIMSLRAIGNAGHAARAVPKINSCLTRPENPMEVRLAAIEAFRRMPCDADRSEIQTVFTNRDEDSELRIAAYLALMQCANSQTIDLVKQQLQTEEVNQVGSFVWSHLTNIKETSNIHKQNIRTILENEDLQSSFDLDNRKFSRNYEKSFFLEKLNTGASAEGNLIWSSSSFLPRSLMANLTVDLFGHSINVFEVGGRVEGLEYVMESYFGPNGYFSDNEAGDVAEQTVKGISSRKMNNINSQFGSSMDELKASLYTRVFGNELGYLRLDGKKSLFNEEFNILELLISMSKNHDYTMTQNFMFMDSSIIIPTSAGFPLNLTVNGTATIDMKASGRMDLRKVATSPRSVSIHGVIEPSAALEVSSMMSVDAFVTKSGMKMVSTLHTSTAIQGKIELDDGHILEMELDMPREKMEIMNFKTAFFTVHKDLHREQEMITENRQTHKICTGDDVARVAGIQLCGEVQFPNASLKADAPYFPLTGPVKMGVELTKKDTLTSYKFETKFVKTKQSVTAKIAFDTPGSTIDRNIGIDFLLNKVDKSLAMNLVSPWKKASLAGSLTYERAHKQFQGRLTIDTNQEYAVSGEVIQSRKGSAYVYTPTFEIRVPGKDNINLGGSFTYLPFKSLQGDLSLTGITVHPMSGQFSIENKKTKMAIAGSMSFEEGKQYSLEARLQSSSTKKSIQYRPFLSIRTPKREVVAFGGSAEYRKGKSAFIDLTLSKIVSKDIKLMARIRNMGNKKSARYQTKMDIRTPYLTTKIQSSVVLRGGKALTTRATVDYVIPKVIRDKITVNGKATLTMVKTLKRIKGLLNVNMRKRPQYNIDGSFDASHQKRKSGVQFDMRYGGNKKDQTKRIVFTTSVGHQKVSWPETTMSVDLDLKHLGMGVDLGFQGSHSHDLKQLETSLTIMPGRQNEASTILRLRNKSKGTRSLSGTLRFSYGSENIQVGNDLNEASDGEFTNVLTAQWATSKKNTIVTTFRLPSSKEFIGSIDMNLEDMRRVRVNGQYVFDLRNMSANTEVRLAKDKYLIAASYNLQDGKTRFATAFEYPSRKLTLEVDAKKKAPLYTGRTILLWDANNDISQRFQLDGQATVVDMNTIDVTVNNKSPLGSYTANIRHRGGIKYQSHADVEWAGSKRISVDTTFTNQRNSDFEGSFQITTPFRGYRSIDIQASHLSERDRFFSKLDVNWKPTKPISATFTLRKPVSLNNLDGEITVKSPLKGFQKITFGFSHKLTNKMSTMGKFVWNNKLVQVNIDGYNKGTDSTRDVSGRVSIKTTLSEVGSMYIAGKHYDNGRRFENNFSMKKDGKGITYEGEMTHHRSGWQVQNTGRFALSALSRKIQSEWNHENTPSTIRTNINGNIGRRNIAINLNANNALAVESGTGSLDVQLGGNVLPVMVIAINHEHSHGLINNTVVIQCDGDTIVSIKNRYVSENGLASSVHKLEAMDNVYTARLESRYIGYPYTGTVDLNWAPAKHVILSASLDHANDLFSGALSLQAPSMKTLSVNFNQNKDSRELVNTGGIQYGSSSVMSLENRLRWDNTKRVFLVVSTQYEDFRRLETNMELTGNLDAFHTRATIELQPVISRTSVSSQWSSQGELIGNVRIDTPFAVLPYSQVTVTSKLENDERHSSLTIEYLPNRIVILETTYKILPGDILGSVALTTPFSAVPRVAAQGKFTGNRRSLRTNIVLEDIYGQKYETKAIFGRGRRLTGEVSIKAPHINDIVAIVNHQGDSRRFNSHGQLTWMNGDRYQADAEFVRIGKWEGKIVLKSPHFNDITVTAHHSGNAERLQSNAVMKYGDQKSELLIIFVNDANVEGSVILRSPFTGEISALFQHNGDLQNFQCHSEIMHQTEKQLEIDASFSNDANTEGTLRIQSPMISPVSVIVNKNGKWNNFQAHGEVQYQTVKKIELDTAFIIIGKVEGSFRLQTPYTEEISAAIGHTGSLNHFQCHAELTYHPSKKIETDLSFSNDNSTAASIAVKSPFFEDISTSLQYEKRANNLNAQGGMQYGQEKIQADASLGWGKQRQLTFALKTPFTEDLHAAFDHTGNWKQFSGHAELSLSPTDKKYEADVTFANARKVKASASLKSKHFKDLKIAFTNKGRLVKFNNKFSAQYGKDKLDTDLLFSLRPSLSTTVVINTPFKGLRKLQASLKHAGSWDSFNTKATASIGKSKILSNARFTLEPLNAVVNIQTPFVGYRQVGASISHAGTRSRFQSRAEFSYGKGKSISGNMQFSKQPFGGTLTVNTPFTGYEAMKVMISHKGNMERCQSVFQMVLPRKQKLSATCTIDLTNAISAEIAIVTPFRGYEKLNAELSHTGTPSRFECHAEVGAGANKIIGDVRFSMLDIVSGEATLVTPFRGFKKTKVAFSQDGSYNDFRSHAEILVKKQKHEVDLTFSSVNSMAASLTINCPYIKIVKASISQSGNPQALTSEGKLSYGDSEVVTGAMNYNSSPSMTGSVTLKSMWTAPATLTFSHAAGVQNFHTQVDAAYGDSHVIVDTTLDISRDISGSVIIRSPFYPIEDLRATISHVGSMSNGRSQIEGIYKGEKIEVIVTIDSEAKKEVSIEIATPFSDYRQMKAAVSHTYTQDMITGSIEIELNEDKIECDAILNMANGVTGRFMAKTPWYNDVIAEFSHTGPITACQSHAELTYSGMRQLQADMTFESQPRKTWTVTINTPWEQVRSLGAIARLQGNLNDFSGYLELTRNDQRILGDVTVSTINGIDTRATLRSPFTKDLILAFTQSGTIMNMQSHAELMYGRIKQMELDASWDVTSSVDGSVSLKTPVEGFNNLLFKLRHVGGFNGFRSKITMVYFMDRKIELQAQFENDAKQEGSITFTSPFTSAFRAAFQKGTEQAAAEMYYNENEKMHVKITYTIIPAIDGTFLFRSVIPGLESISGALRYEGSLQNMNAHAEVARNGHVSQVDVTFTNGFKMQGSVRIRTPFEFVEDIGASFSHKHGGSILESAVQINYAEKQGSGEISLRWGNSIDASFRITTPFRNYRNIRGTLTHTGTIQQFTCHADFQYAPSKKMSCDVRFSSADAREGGIVVKTPFSGFETLSAAFRHEPSHDDLTSHIELSYQSGKKFELDVTGLSRDMARGQVTIKTPFAGYEETVGAFRYTNTSNGFDAHMEATYSQGQKLETEISISPREGRFMLKTPFNGYEEMTAAFTDELTAQSVSGHAEVTYQGQKMETDVFFSYSNGKATIKTPFAGYEEMSASFTHQGNMDSFVFHVDASYMSRLIVAVDVTFSSSNGLVSFTTPFEGYEQLSAHFTGAEMSKTAQIVYATGQTIEVAVKFSPASGRVTIKTPYVGYEEMTATFRQTMANERFTGNLKISPKVSETFEMSIDLSSTSGQLTIKTPLIGYETMSASFNNQISDGRFSYDSELTYLPGKKIELQLIVSSENSRLAVKTPFIGYEEMSIGFTSQLTESSIATNVDIMYGTAQKIDLEVNLSSNNGHVVVKTPFRGYEAMSFTFSNQMTDRSIATKVEMSYIAGQKIELDLALSPENGHITVKTPFSGYEVMSAAFTNRMTDRSIATTVEMSYVVGQKVELDLALSPENGHITVKTPFSGYEELSASFTNRMTDHSITTHIEVNHVAMDFDIAFSPDYGHITVQTPLTGYEHLSAAFTNKMTDRRIDNHIEITYLPGRKLETDISLSSVKGEIIIRTPFSGYEELSAAFSNQITNRSIDSHIEITYLPGRKLETEISLSLEKGQIIIRTPFTGYEEMSAVFTNQMTDRSIDIHLEITYLPGRMLETEISLSREQGHVVIRTPFSDYEEMSAAYTNQQTDRSIDIHLEITYLPGRKLETEISLTLEKGHITMRTPFPGYEEISAAFANQMTDRSIDNHMEITYLPGRKLETNTFLSPAKGQITIRTPFPGYEEMSAAFTNKLFDVMSGSPTQDGSLSGSFEVSYKPGQKVGIDMSLSAMTGHMTFQTPFVGYETISASYETVVDVDSASTKLQFSYDSGEIFEADISLSLTEGHIKIKTPITGFQTLSGEYTLSTRRTSFALNVKVTGPSNRTFVVSVNLAYGTRKNVNIVVRTPFSGYEQMGLTLSHVMRNGNMKSSASIDYGQKIEAAATLDTRGGTRASFTIKTPFEGYELTKMSFVFANNARSVNSQSSIEFGRQRGEYELSINLDPSFEGNFVLKTPFSGFEMTSLAIQHGSSAESQHVHAQLSYSMQRTIQLDMTIQTANGYVGSITLNTPFSGFETSTGSFEINMSDSRLTSNIAAAVGDRTIRTTLNFAMDDNSFTNAITLQTPFQNFENMGVKLNVAGSWENSQVDFTVMYADTKPVELLLKHTLSSDRLAASITIRTLYTPEATFSIAHNGNWMAFSNTVQAAAGREYSLQHDLVCRFDDNLVDISSTLNSRYNERRDSVMSTFKHEGSINNFRTNFANKFNGRKSAMAVSFRNTASIDGSFTLQTPFRNIAATLQHSGDLDQFSTVANVQLSPSKQIAAKVDFFKHRLRRINANIELTTPFEGLELTKMTYRHTVSANDIKSFGEMTYGSDRLSGSLKASKSPLAFDVSVQTPFTNYEELAVKAKYARQGLSHNVNMNLKYNTGKEIVFRSSVDLAANPITLAADLATPFAGYETTELRYTHEGRFPNFICTAEFTSSYVSRINGELSVRFKSLTDIQTLITFTSPFFENVETVRFILRNQKDHGEYQSHTEVAWTQTDVIVLDGTFSNIETWNGNTGRIVVSLATPFSPVRSMSFEGHHELVSTKYSETVSAQWNGEKMFDVGVEFGKDTAYVAAVTMRAPLPMSFSANGELSETVSRGDLNLNWNTETQDSNMIMDASLTDSSDRFTSRRDLSMTVTLPRKTVGVTGSFSKSSVVLSSSGNLIIDGVNKFGLDFETSAKNKRNNMEQGNKLAIRLPSRTLKATGLFSDKYGTKMTEGAIFWDADRDETKKIGVRGTIVPQGLSTKADFSVSFPSIGKDVKLDSEVTLNSGNVIFDGKTEFSYSGDASKNLVIHSRVEDLSSGFRKNYSFVVGVSHPATTIDVQLSSHVGHADNKYSAGIDVHYLTANRNRKNFALIGEIDKMRKQMKVEMISPVKSVKLSGQATTSVPYRLSIHNLYDERPVDAQLTIDPSQLSMDFHMNYDMENPTKVIHAEAKYLNDRAIKAEIYREENTERITDSVFTMRLNTSRILHTRLHWRPAIIQDMKTSGLRQMVRNNRDLVELYNEITNAVNEEVNAKYNNIRTSVLDEMTPFVQMAAINMRGMQQDIAELQRTVTCDQTQRMLEVLSQYLETAISESDGLTRWMETAASTRVSYPMKDAVDAYIHSGREMVQAMGLESRMYYGEMMDHLDQKLGELSATVLHTFKTYHDHLTNAIAQPLNMELVHQAKAKYNEYLTQLTNQLPAMTDMADQYTSTLYNSRERINSAMYGLLDRPEIGFIHSQAAAAYKFWEVEENTKSSIKAVYDYIIEVIDEEIEALKSIITDLEKTKITVFDPAHGEIQTDTYLIVPMTTLKALPNVDISQHYNTMKSYLPDPSKLRNVSDYIPSSDVSNWIPPFDAFAKVEGNTFTTFDGKTYQFRGRCSYVLAGDYVDGNFSIVLDYMGKQKRKLVITTTQHAVQLLPKGKLRVDGAIVEMPYHSHDVSVINEGEDITVTGHGFTVRHNVPASVYEIGLSGWYYGKTGGLLGTYDNERRNDMMTPSRQITTDVSSFADTWEVKERCR